MRESIEVTVQSSEDKKRLKCALGTIIAAQLMLQTQGFDLEKIKKFAMSSFPLIMLVSTPASALLIVDNQAGFISSNTSSVQNSRITQSELSSDLSGQVSRNKKWRVLL